MSRFVCTRLAGSSRTTFAGVPTSTWFWGFAYDWQSNLGRTNDFAPRVAFACARGEEKTVFRGGVGLFFEQIPQAAVWKTMLFNNLNQVEFVVTNPNFPNRIALGRTAVPRSISRLAHNLDAPYLLHASFAMERKLSNTKELTFDVYTMRGVHLFCSRDVNAPLPNTGLRPIPDFLNLDEIQSLAASRRSLD